MKQIRILFHGMIIFSILLSGCGGAAKDKSAGSVEEFDVEALFQGVELSFPMILEVKPAFGELLQPEDVVHIVFDQSMDESSFDSAWLFTDMDGKSVPGVLSWTADTTQLDFTPDIPFEIGKQYKLEISEVAVSVDGENIDEGFFYVFDTADYLAVDNIYPTADAEEVELDSKITVSFSAPVVALQSLEARDENQPFIITPAVAGKGQWINTSTYIFTPDEGLVGNTVYTVDIKKGLMDATGNEFTSLQNDVSWEFTTVAPGIKSIQMGGQVFAGESIELEEPISTEPYIRIDFLQEMDPEITNPAIHLLSPDWSEIPLIHEWDEGNLSVVVQVEQPLEFNKGFFKLQIEEEASTKNGGMLGEEVEIKFNSVPEPDEVRLHVLDGPYEAHAALYFETEMDYESVREHLIISPYSDNIWLDMVGDSGNYVGLEELHRGTTYQITLLPGAKDIYGNKTKEKFSETISLSEIWPHTYFPYDSYPQIRANGPQEIVLEHAMIQYTDLEMYKTVATEVLFRKSWDDYKEKYELQYHGRIPLSYTTIAYAREKIDLTFGGKHRLEPGFYIASFNFSRNNDNHVIWISVVTDSLLVKITGEDLLVWMTDLKTGEPTAGATITVYNPSGMVVGESKTDSNGLVRWDVNKFQNPSELSFVAESDNRLGVSGNYSNTYDIYEYGDYWDYFKNVSYDEKTAYIYTDRAIYRPGDTVYFKGILRNDLDMFYTIPNHYGKASLHIDNELSQVFSSSYELTEFGGFSGSFTLDEDAELGVYNLWIEDKSNVWWHQNIGEVEFEVSEYRKPEFSAEIRIRSEMLNNETVGVNMESQYYYGGAVKNADVSYRVHTEPYWFKPQSGYYNYRFYDLMKDIMRRQNEEEEMQLILEGNGETDENGHFQFFLEEELVSDADESLVVSVDTTVSDLAGTVVSDHEEVIFHNSMIYAGIDPERYIGYANEEQKFNLVAVNWDGEPVADQSMRVDISHFYVTWHYDQNNYWPWYYTIEEEFIETLPEVKTDKNGKSAVMYTPTSSGLYLIRVMVVDEFGNESTSSVVYRVSGGDYYSWGIEDKGEIEITTDKDEYKPGDVAQLLISSPFEGISYGLITFERGKIHDMQVVEINSNTIIEVPITSEMASIIYPVVMIVKGVGDGNAYPDYETKIIKLNVSSEEKELDVNIASDIAMAMPGDEVTFDISVNDYEGNPVNAELSLALVDVAVLDLVDDNSISIVEYFYGTHGIYDETSISLTRLIEELPDYDLLFELNYMKGGGGGNYEPPEIHEAFVLRENFPDTAYWYAEAVTDEEGKYRVTVEMPDSLTKWRLDVRAVTKDTLVGQNTLDITAAKPLMLRPQTPRFFVVGDEVQIGTAVQNSSSETMKVNVSVDVSGLILQENAEKEIEIQAGEQVFVTWDVLVPEDEVMADFEFYAISDSYTDASKQTFSSEGLPIYRYEALETIGTAGVLTDAEIRTELVQIPQNANLESGNMLISVDSTIAGSVKNEIQFDYRYSQRCLEGVATTLLRNLYANEILQRQGIDDRATTSRLDIYNKIVISYLEEKQMTDGGWGWCPDSIVSNDRTSAYIMFALWQAEQEGYQVNPSVVKTGRSYLIAQLKSDLRDDNEYRRFQMNSRAHMLYVLSLMEYQSPAQMNKLFDQWQTLSLAGRADLMQTIAHFDSEDERIEVLYNSLVQDVILSSSGAHWEENTRDYVNWGSNTRSTAVVLSAISTIDADEELGANTIRWLMAARDAGFWNSEYESAWALRAIAYWLESLEISGTNYVYGIKLNDEIIGKGMVNEDFAQNHQEYNIAVQDMAVDQLNSLSFARSAGDGNLYYTSLLDLYLPANTIGAYNQGIGVSRKYYSLDDLSVPVTEAQQGDLLIAQITMEVSSNHYYVHIEDMLPAGMEIVDTDLNTSQKYYGELGFQRTKGKGWYDLEQEQFMDEKLEMWLSYLPAGTYTYTYLVRVSFPGTYNVIPTVAQEFYFPDVYGRGDGSQFVILP